MTDAHTAGIRPAAAPAPEAEESFYFASAGRRLFATLHAPAPGSPPRGGWLCCGPFGEERGYAQRTTVVWARALAAAGHWVLRFDYAGYGDSEGWFEQFTADDHVADALAAHAELERRSGVPCVGLWGMRLGAAIAAVAAARGKLPVALALWEPVVSGDRYMDALFRATMVKEMANTGRAPRTRDQLKEHLAGGGEVLVEGHPLKEATYRSIAAIDLTRLEAQVRGPAFVAQVAPRPQSRAKQEAPVETRPRREIQALCAALGDAHLELVRVPPPWQDNFEYEVSPEALFAPTLRWVNALPGAAARRVTPASSPAERELRSHFGAVERAVSIPSPGGTIRGILHLPPGIDRARPAVLMMPPGSNCRTARHRLYVRLARELSERGVVSLRVDPHGIGESGGTLDVTTLPDVYNAVESGLFMADARAGLLYLDEELGIGSAHLLGLCGGAATSVWAAGSVDARVAGIVASELPFLFTPRDGSDEGQAPPPVARAAADHFLRSYLRKVFDPVAWRRFFTLQSDYQSLWRSLKIAMARRVLPQRATADDEWYRAHLGPGANLPLIARFRACLERRIPILCVFGATRHYWHFSEAWPGLQRSVPDAAKRVVVKSIPDADPGFSLPAHSREFLDTVVSWIEAHSGPRRDAERRTASGA